MRLPQIPELATYELSVLSEYTWKPGFGNQSQSTINVAIRPNELDEAMASDPALLFLDERHGEVERQQ